MKPMNVEMARGHQRDLSEVEGQVNAVEDGGGRLRWRRGRVAARARAVGSGWRQVICNSKWVIKYDPLAEATCSFAGRNQRC